MKARGGLLFLQRFLMKADLSHFLFTMSKQARSWEKVDFSLSTQRKSAQRQSFTGFFMCVEREMRTEKNEVSLLVFAR